MSKKLRILIGLNALLLSAVVISLVWKFDGPTIGNVDSPFSVTDTAAVERIVLGRLVFEKKDLRTWTLNGTYEADRQRIGSMLSLFQRLEIKKEIPPEARGEMEAQFQKSAVEVGLEGAETVKFRIWGQNYDNYIQREGDERIYAVHLPGYFIAIYDFLNAHADEWRDKRIFKTNWRTLKSLRVDYENDPANSFSVVFEGGFYNIPGVSTLDSVRLYDYLAQYTVLQAVSFEKREGLDSVVRFRPVCTISVEDLNPENSDRLIIYPGKDHFRALSGKSGEVFGLSLENMRAILVNRQFFEKQP